jgi:hypothetical protein
MSGTNLIARASPGVVHFEDNGGKTMPEISPEMIQELKRRAATPGPRYTGAQVQARLRALQEEWDHTGGFDLAHMQDVLKRLNDADPGRMGPQGFAG